MRRNPAANQKPTRGAVHLMNREIRAPKGEISPFPQASWRRHHDSVKFAPRKRTGHAPSASPRMLSEGRVPSKEFASDQHRVYPMDAASSKLRLLSKRSLRPVSCVCKTVQQYTGANRQPTTPSQKRTRDRLKSNRGGLDCVSRHSTRSTLMASKSSTVHSRRPNSDKIKKPKASTVQSQRRTRLKSKVSRNPSHLTAEYQKLWRGFCRLSKND